MHDSQNTKQVVLVLCHTILHNAFRSAKYGQTLGVSRFKKFVQSRFIADFIVEIGSESPEGFYFAYTSKKVFNEFTIQVVKEFPGTKKLDETLFILRNLISCDSTKAVDALDKNEGIIVIADQLCNRNDYEPWLITDMKDKKVEVAKEYYRPTVKKGTRLEDITLPFSILNLEEAIRLLRGRFSKQFITVRKRDQIYDII